MRFVEASRPVVRGNFSIAIPARLANQTQPPKRRGFLAEHGRFPFRERIPATNTQADADELRILRKKTVEQRRRIETLEAFLRSDRFNA